MMHNRGFQEFKPRTILDKILDNKLLFITVIFIFLALVVVYIIFTDKQYKTDATIEITPKSNKILTSIPTVSKSDVDFMRNIQTQMDFLKSRYLINKVATKLKSNIKFLEKNSFSFNTIDNKSIFKIIYFKIKDDSFYNTIFKIKYINDKQFSLNILSKYNPDTKESKKALIYEFDKAFDSKYFSFKIKKISLMREKEAYFKLFEMDRYVKYVQKNLSAYNSSLNSGMITLEYFDTTKSEAQRFLNTHILEFLTINKQNQLKDISLVLTMLEKKIEKEKDKLKSLRVKLQSYAQLNNTSGLNNQTSNTINIMYKYESDLENLNLKKKKLEVIRNILSASDDYELVLASLGELKNSSILTLTKLIQEDKKNLANLRLKYKDIHPDIQKIQKSIENKVSTLKNNITQMLSDVKSEYQNKSEYLKKYREKLQNIPQKEIGYSNLKLEYDFVEKNYLFLLNKKNQLLIEKKVKGDYKYKIIDFAYEPKYISKPKKRFLLPLALMLGVIFGVLAILFKEYFDKNLKTPNDVESITKIPLIGTIPLIKNNLGRNLFVFKTPNTLVSKMIWSLRSTIENFLTKDKKAHIITISSTIKGEGKTTIAANLGLAFGMGDKKTLLMSMDFKLPQLHKKFGLSNNRGFSSLLIDNPNFDEAIYQLKEFNNFSFMPSGSDEVNTNDLIDSKKVSYIFEKLEKEYDYIVIDLPPFSVAPESIGIMKRADLNIIVLKSNYSQKSFINYVENIKSKNGIENIAFVLNGIKKKYISIVSKDENKKYIYKNS